MYMYTDNTEITIVGMILNLSVYILAIFKIDKVYLHIIHVVHALMYK